MVNIPVIAKRELNTFFLSPIAYLVLAGFAVGHGLLFAVFLWGSSVDLNAVAGSAFWVALYLLIVTVPLITMGLLSEEASSGTIETLLTTPVSDMEVVLGKYLGALLFGVAMLAPIALECVYLAAMGTLDYGPVAAGFLGLYLLIAQFVAIGLFCSSLTRVQVGSAIISFVMLLGLFFLWLVVRDRSSLAAVVLRYMAPPVHYDGFVKGIVDTRDLVYFASTTALFLFLSVRVLESRRWRGTA